LSVRLLIAARDRCEVSASDLLALPRFAYLKNKSHEEVEALQQIAQLELKRYEDALPRSQPPRSAHVGNNRHDGPAPVPG
jgi:hypothetical protein